MFKWKPEFSVNVEEIDKQHKRLFELGGRIYDIASLKDSFDHYDEIMEVLDELRSYTDYHFNYEEKLMTRYNFEGYEEHSFEHLFFMKKLDRIEKKDIDSAQNETALDLVKFVANWIEDHILKSDMKYKDFFNSKGIR